MQLVNAHVVIEGKVQGVYFRMETKRQAEILGVKGWVRNKRDGSVEATLEGKDSAVKEMIAWCHKGPFGARVTDVRVQWGKYSGEFVDFSMEAL